jgi:hypothetical protein
MTEVFGFVDEERMYTHQLWKIVSGAIRRTGMANMTWWNDSVVALD